MRERRRHWRGLHEKLEWRHGARNPPACGGRSRLLHDGRSGRWRHGGSGTAGLGWLIREEEWQHGRVIKRRYHIRVVPPKHLAAVQKPDIYAAAADVKL